MNWAFEKHFKGPNSLQTHSIQRKIKMTNFNEQLLKKLTRFLDENFEGITITPEELSNNLGDVIDFTLETGPTFISEKGDLENVTTMIPLGFFLQLLAKSHAYDESQIVEIETEEANPETNPQAKELLEDPENGILMDLSLFGVDPADYPDINIRFHKDSAIHFADLIARSGKNPEVAEQLEEIKAAIRQQIQDTKENQQ